VRGPPPKRHEWLRTEWAELCSGWIASLSDRSAAFDELVERYTQSHRAYHTLEHVEHCLRDLAAAEVAVHDPAAVRLAVWFHDAVYDVHRADNEEQSANLAEAWGRRLRVPTETLDRVRPLILLTRHARALDADASPDSRLLSDVDLAILGGPPSVFARYDADIRREYAWVPEDAYRAGRARVLQRFLDRPSIYATECFRLKLEARARRNLSDALRRLAGS
jgi:predicted metal-dependent HD superfamily phosphohydrolase